eukprot:m.236306 g.236306  ORF g.236306 m.236306 type:complete len:250 (-) comp20524_c0_seq1:51-800(-)
MERFLLRAKSVRGAAAKALIAEALSAPDLFVFGELLALPNIQELKDSSDKSAFLALEMFAYGTLQEYKAAQASLPELNEAQLNKLRVLTLITLAGTAKELPYDMLLQQLLIGTVRELEDLIIDAIYSEVVGGKLDQSRMLFEVHFAIGRDVRLDDLRTMRDTLSSWCDNCASVLALLSSEMEKANASKLTAKKHNDMLQAEMEKVRADLLQRLEGSVAGDGAAQMDVEESEGRRMLPRSRRPRGRDFRP